MKDRSRAARLLSEKLMSQTDLAKELDVTPQAVSAWINGRTTPTPDRMAKLEELLGIPMRAWTEEDAAEEPAA